jgi:hypothetical protein
VSVQRYERYLYILHMNKETVFLHIIIKVTYVGCTKM